MTTTGADMLDGVAVCRTPSERRWDRTRACLVVGWLFVTCASLTIGERPTSWAELTAAVAAGKVDSVQVTGALPGSRDTAGYAVVDVTWRSGLWRHVTQVVQVRGRDKPRRPLSDGASAVVRADPGELLTKAQPDLHVDRRDVRSSSTSLLLLGWRVPLGMGLANLVLFLGCLSAVVYGPEPWRATRWAWFWLLCTPVGIICFAVLSGPARRVRAPRDISRRLTGGWAFLLLLATGALLQS